MTPAVLETMKALAGVANAERISESNKALANQLLGKMLDVIAKDVNNVHSHETSLITKPIGPLGQA